jgi:predicted glycosyltransferase
MSSGLIYSQAALGIGQIVRSLYICRALVKFFEIDFLIGTPPINCSVDSPRFHLHQMPALWLSEWSDPPELVDPEGIKTAEEIFVERKRYLESFPLKPYDFLIIELFPFSKEKFRNEIEFLIKKLKAINPACLVICSLRDIVGEKTVPEQKQIVELVNKYFDYIFVHSDPQIITLRETFAMASAIENKIFYTGYVSDPSFIFNLDERKKQIVISLGGGSYGLELPRSVVLAALGLPEFQFLFLLGPKSPALLREDLKLIKKTGNLENVQISEFSPQFCNLLQKSSLSISLGGSTLVDIVKTQTPALVYPLAHVEHVLRARKFEALGLIKVLSLEDLIPENLCRLILQEMNHSFPNISLNLNGAEITALQINNKIKN